MANEFASFSDIFVYNSITNNRSGEEKYDISTPFTFIEFLNYSKNITEDLQNFKQYEQYVNKWDKIQETEKSNRQSSIKNQYLELFREITLKYSSIDEKRFLENIDFSSEEDLNIILPFYAKKLKEICLYYKEKRNTYKKEFREVKNKGSVQTVRNFIKNTINELFIGDDVPPGVTTTLPLSTLLRNIQVEVEESYNTFNNYYDIDPDNIEKFYTNEVNVGGDVVRSSNTNNINRNTFLDFEKAILDLINEKSITLTELKENSPSILFDLPPDFDLLNQSDFIDYNITTRDNLKIILEADLVKNLIGTDYYYLSTNTFGDVLSGELFEASSPVRNILNTNFPTSLTVPVSSYQYERSIGTFFLPTKYSLLKMKGGFEHYTAPVLSAGYIYIFPDPQSYGTISGLSKTQRPSPFRFETTLDEFKNKSSSYGQRFPKSSYIDQNFFAYDSKQQKRTIQRNLSSFSSFYSESYNEGVVRNINYDINGNVFLEFVVDDTYINEFKQQNTVNDKIIFEGSNTILDLKTQSSKIEKRKAYFDKVIEPKNVFVYNLSANTYTPLISAFDRVFSKFYNFQDDVKREIQNNLLNFYVYDDVFSLQTQKYVIIDSFDFDGTFKPSTNTPLFVINEQEDVSNNFSSVSNDLINGNTLFKIIINKIPDNVLEKATLDTSSSTSNNIFYYEFYSYNLKTKKIYSIISRKKNSVAYFNTFFNLNLIPNQSPPYLNRAIKPKSLKNANLSYSSRANLYNLVVQYNDLNDNIFIHNVVFEFYNNEISFIDNSLYLPDNYFFTTNFFYTNLSGNYYDYTTISGDVRIKKDEEVLQL